MGSRLDSADVVIVGGGIVGVSTAHLLRSRGFDVVIVEQRDIAYGASGRNPGFLTTMVRAAGIDLDMSRLGRRFYREVVAELDLSFEYRTSGCAAFFDDPAHEPLYREFVEARNRDGVELELLDSHEARQLLPLVADHVAGAVYSAEDAQMRTPMFVAEMARVCRERGVRIHERTPVLRLLISDGRVTGVNTVRGTVSADHVLVATGAWANQLLEQEGVSVPIQPQRTALLQTAPVSEPLAPITFGPSWLLNSPLVDALPSIGRVRDGGPQQAEPTGRWFGELVAQRADGSVLYGDTHELPAPFDHALSAWALETLMASFANRLSGRSDLHVEKIWSGLIPRTPDRIPIVGPLDALPGAYIAAGHYGGNLHGPASAILITELLTGEEPSLPLEDLALDREGLP